jgi:hypothetical protein
MGLYDSERLNQILEHPHLLGLLVGKDKMTELHSNWIKYIWCDHGNRSLQAHRGSYKTTAMEVGAIYWMLFHPNDSILFIRKSFTQAAEIVGVIYNMMQTTEIQELFKFVHGEYPEVRNKRKDRIEFKFKRSITPEGNLNAFGLDGGMVGQHADFVLLDDFVTIRDKLSRAERERTVSMVREISTNIINPDKPSRFVGTPWHKEDAWSICPTPRTYNCYETGILSLEQIEEKKKTSTLVDFTANYLLTHINDENAIFAEPTMGKWQFSGIDKPKAHLDAAFTGDCTNALTIFARRYDGTIQGIGFVNSGNVKDWMNFIHEMYRKYNVSKIYNEDNPDKGYTQDALKKMGMNVGCYHEQMQKHAKIVTHLVDIYPRIVWADETEDEYLAQIMDYRERSEPCDAPDSASSLAVQGGYSSTKANRMNRYIL